MKKMRTPVKITIISAAVVIFLVIAVMIGFRTYLIYSHNLIINSKPDTTQWVLENDNFTIVPKFEDKYVSFTVENKNGEKIFDFKNEWRAWDFKTVTIEDDNDIVIYTGDMGEQIYEYKDDKWIFKYK